MCQMRHANVHRQLSRTAFCVVIAAILPLAGCSGDESLEQVASVSTQREAVEVVSALEQSDVPGVRLVHENASPESGEYRILAPSDSLPFARIALAELGLPRPDTARTAGTRDSIFPTRADDVSRQLALRGATLARDIELLDGVATASVQIIQPASASLVSREQPPPRMLVVARCVGALSEAREFSLREAITRIALTAEPSLDASQGLTILLSGREGPLFSPAAKLAIAQARQSPKGNKVQIVEFGIVARYVAPMLVIAAVAVLTMLSLRDRWRAFASR